LIREGGTSGNPSLGNVVARLLLRTNLRNVSAAPPTVGAVNVIAGSDMLATFRSVVIVADSPRILQFQDVC
jgi:hypothetical protein